MGKRLAEYNHRKREELKAQQQKSEGPSRVSQYYGIGVILALGVIGSLGKNKKGEVPPQQPSHPQQNNPPKANKFEMD